MSTAQKLQSEKGREVLLAMSKENQASKQTIINAIIVLPGWEKKFLTAYDQASGNI